MAMKLIADTEVVFGTESHAAYADLAKVKSITDKADTDGDADFDSDEDDTDDDAAEEALLADLATESRANAFDFAVESMGGLQSSLLLTTARLGGIDTASDPGFIAIETLGANVPEVSIEMAITALEDQQRSAIESFSKSVEVSLGKMVNVIPNLIAKLPGGEAVNNLFASTTDKLTGPTAAAVIGALGVASGLFQVAHASLSENAILSHAGELKGGEVLKFGKLSTMLGDNANDPFQLIRKRGAALRKNLAIERGTAAELGWTKATWTKVISMVTDLSTKAKKLIGDIGQAVKMMVSSPVPGEGKALNIMRGLRGIRALVSITNFLIFGVLAFLIVKIIRLTSKAARRSDANAAAA